MMLHWEPGGITRKLVVKLRSSRLIVTDARHVTLVSTIVPGMWAISNFRYLCIMSLLWIKCCGYCVQDVIIVAI